MNEMQLKDLPQKDAPKNSPVLIHIHMMQSSSSPAKFQNLQTHIIPAKTTLTHRMPHLTTMFNFSESTLSIMAKCEGCHPFPVCKIVVILSCHVSHLLEINSIAISK